MVLSSALVLNTNLGKSHAHTHTHTLDPDSRELRLSLRGEKVLSEEQQHWRRREVKKKERNAVKVRSSHSGASVGPIG